MCKSDVFMCRILTFLHNFKTNFSAVKNAFAACFLKGFEICWGCKLPTNQDFSFHDISSFSSFSDSLMLRRCGAMVADWFLVELAVLVHLAAAKITKSRQ